MADLFGIDIAGEVADGFETAGGVFTAELSKVIEGERDPENLSAGRATVTKLYGCKGFWEDYKTKEIDGTQVHAEDRKALILGGTLPTGIVPTKGDKISITEAGVTELGYILRVERDPAAATYILYCGKR